MLDLVKNKLQVSLKTNMSGMEAFFTTIASNGGLSQKSNDLLIDFQQVISASETGEKSKWREVIRNGWEEECYDMYGQRHIDNNTIEFLTASTGVPSLIRELSRQYSEVELYYICELKKKNGGYKSIGTFVFHGGNCLIDSCYKQGTKMYKFYDNMLNDDRIQFSAENSEIDEAIDRIFHTRQSEDEIGEKYFVKSTQTLELDDFSVRSSICLKRANIHTIEDVVALTREELLLIRNFNEKCLDDVVEKLRIHGLQLKNEPVDEEEK